MSKPATAFGDSQQNAKLQTHMGLYLKLSQQCTATDKAIAFLLKTTQNEHTLLYA